MKQPWILLIGGRSAAIRAAQRLGLLAVVAAEAPFANSVQELAHECLPIQFDDRQSLNPHMNSWKAHRPVAVVATTEASVLPAAWIRSELRMKGLLPAAAERFRNKHRMKSWFRKHQLPCADSEPLDRATTAKGLIKRLGLPLVLKHRKGFGSRGTVVCRDAASVKNALPTFQQSSSMAESFVPGREVSVESFIGSPMGEKSPEGKGQILWTNITSYEIPGQASLLPCPDELPHQEELMALNTKAVQALGLDQGMTHLEAFCSPTGWIIGEIAARPPGGYLMDLIQLSYGFDPWECYLQLYLRQPPTVHLEPKAFSAAHMLRPAPGIVTAVKGVKEARKLPGVVLIRSEAKVGKVVQPALSVSHSAGRIVVSHESAQATRETLRRAVHLIEIQTRPQNGSSEAIQAD